jgi:acyl-coenzyme A synthetase/AMP-(fatty) acid ligase
VRHFAGVLTKHGVQKGDRVLIYMPMIPEATIAMLASARIGAMHSLVFGGFASKELATRITHAEVGSLTSDIKVLMLYVHLLTVNLLLFCCTFLDFSIQ